MSEQEITPIRKGSEQVLKIESLAYGGRGVGRLGDFVVFVDRALPGQTVKVFLYRKRRGFGEGRIVEVLEESPDAVTPPCAHAGLCGGCTLQHYHYEAQLEQKKLQVEDSLRRIGGWQSVSIQTVIGADPIFHYRNKMEFTISPRRWIPRGETAAKPAAFALGLHIPGRFDKVLDIDDCFLQPEIGNRILNRVRTLALQHSLKPYDPKTHIGFLRHLMLRYGHRTGDVMVNLVTSYENLDLLLPVVEDLRQHIPEITSIVNNINTRRGDTAYGEREILLHGDPFIREDLGHLTFQISANSFFQTNTLQAERLYAVVREKARIRGTETVLDLYCGAGTIGLYLAREAREVIGVEVSPSAVEDARRNAELNGITNARFLRANLDRPLGRLAREGSPELIIVDPPRVGLHRETIDSILRLAPDRIVYVSCNPTTLARDLQLFTAGGYQPGEPVVVDMFPHTAHIETVVDLIRPRH
ncbi:MAG: 23S rRNA (uracil(1939)-C(5))-methyltransferase RlmD [Candidatus Neomarinimicrobiota bacterium]|nr:MAG: 23S rRNA (uracil(1939)-C(5))-methyltransferase RlmD [Candidatus Neomarinimicrobiota bacterium]